MIRTQNIHPGSSARGPRSALRVDDLVRPKADRAITDDALPGLAWMVRFDWAAMDAWFEEDEEVFVHPRNPYSRSMPCARAGRSESSGTALCWPNPPRR